MRQLADIADDAVAADILADGKGDLRLVLCKLRRVDDLARHDDRYDPVRHLDADHGDLVRDGRDAHARRAERQRDVVRQIRDLRELDAALQLQLIPRDRRAACDVDDVRLDAERLQRIAQPLRILPHFLGAVVRLTAPGLQKVDGRELILGLCGLLLRDLLRDLRGLELHVRLFELFRLLRRLQRRKRFFRGRGGLRLRFGCVKMVDDERRHLPRLCQGNDVRDGGRFFFRFRLRHLCRRLRLVGDQRVKLRLVVGMHLRLCLRGGGRFRGLRLLRGRCGRLCLPAAVLHKNIRPHGRRALCTLFGRLFGQGRIVDRQVELAHPRRAALLSPLDMLDVVCGDSVDDGLCGVLMLALRFGIFGARPVLDGGHNARDRHIEARDQAQQHSDDHHDHRADPADERREQACQPAGQHAPGRAADAAVPERGDDFPALRRVKASAYQLHQTADQRGRQKRTRYAQRDGTAVMQDEDEKAHHEREWQDIEPRADQPPEYRPEQIQDRRVDPEAAQHRQQRQHQTHAGADLPPDGRGLLLGRLFPPAGGGRCRFSFVIGGHGTLHLTKSGTGSASADPRPSSNSKIRRISRAARYG